MKTIETAYINALLADASYIQVAGGINSDDMKRRMTETQAAFIDENFEVLDSIETSTTLGMGFDAVVWRGKAGTTYEGQTFVSMRGTQGAADIADDISLATTGVPKDQIVGMVNWWLRITAPASATTVQQIQYTTVTHIDPVTGAVSNEGAFSLAASIPRTGPFIDVSSITGVNGHSLGGYLATVFTRLFGNQFGVQSVTTFNSAGFSNVAANNINASFNQIAQLLGLTGSITINGKTLGSAKANGQRDAWTAELTGEKFNLRVYDDTSSSTGKKLIITKVGDNSNNITINNFKLDQASSTGYLGIQLDNDGLKKHHETKKQTCKRSKRLKFLTSKSLAVTDYASSPT